MSYGNTVEAVSGVIDIDEDGTDELVFSSGQELRYLDPTDDGLDKIKVQNGSHDSNNGIGIGPPAEFSTLGLGKRVPIGPANGNIKLVRPKPNTRQNNGQSDVRKIKFKNASPKPVKKHPVCPIDIDGDGAREIVYIGQDNTELNAVKLNETDSNGDPQTLKIKETVSTANGKEARPISATVQTGVSLF